jgi:hypothetical protein
MMLIFTRRNGSKKLVSLIMALILFIAVITPPPGIMSDGMISKASAATGALGYNRGDVVISQIYTNGGNSGAYYKTKYFELYNRTNSDINFNSQWSIGYSATTATSFGAGSRLI